MLLAPYPSKKGNLLLLTRTLVSPIACQNALEKRKILFNIIIIIFIIYYKFYYYLSSCITNINYTFSSKYNFLTEKCSFGFLKTTVTYCFDNKGLFKFVHRVYWLIFLRFSRYIAIISLNTVNRLNFLFSFRYEQSIQISSRSSCFKILPSTEELKINGPFL